MSYFIRHMRFVRFMTLIEQYFQITEGEVYFCNCSLMVSNQPSNQGKLYRQHSKWKEKAENCS